MKTLLRLGLVPALAAAVTLGLAGTASAAPRPHGGLGDHVVFVQTDNTAGNHVVAYDRADDGALTLANTYATGGLGGQLTGAVVDYLASQGSLVYDATTASLFAVNAGSNTVSVFRVQGDKLALRQVIGSGGTFPVSVAVDGRLVYVLNALNGGSVQGYTSSFGRLVPLPGSNRPLGLNASATPQFVNTPGQVAFSPDGSQLIVTTKANGNDIDVFGVAPSGRLSANPVVNSESGTVPFAVTFTGRHTLVVAEAGTNALATFSLDRSGTVSLIDSVATGQAATCWVTPAGGYLYASNAGSASLSGLQASDSGQLSLIGATTTDPGTVDAAATPGGRYLYVQTGANGIVDEFQVLSDGSLSSLGSITVAGSVGGEGIVAL
jgi:hypothetical protein